ncbi:MAG: GFA family protein [Bauldia sp.]
MAMLTGRCLCGAVEYAVADEFLYAAYCHCSRCRAATGAAAKPFAGIAVEKLRITKGEDSLLIYGTREHGDIRCGRCGAFLFSAVGERVHVSMGTLVDAPSIRPSEHIFVASKAAWDEITDDLPQYAGHVFEGPPIDR